MDRMTNSNMISSRGCNFFRTLVVLLCVGFSLVFSGCTANIRTGEVEVRNLARFTLPAFPETGSHAVEIFNEMHYQPSYRIQEGPRILPPSDSVPVTGREIRYSTLEQYSALSVPRQLSEEYDHDSAARLYDVNCLVCHGKTLRGTGEVDESQRAKILKFWPKNAETGVFIGPAPANLLGDLTVESTDGELYAFVSNGGRQGFAYLERGMDSESPMPEFRLLLTEDERWQLVKYIRSIQTSR